VQRLAVNTLVKSQDFSLKHAATGSNISRPPSLPPPLCPSYPCTFVCSTVSSFEHAILLELITKLTTLISASSFKHPSSGPRGQIKAFQTPPSKSLEHETTHKHSFAQHCYIRSWPALMVKSSSSALSACCCWLVLLLPSVLATLPPSVKLRELTGAMAISKTLCSLSPRLRL
jgi:hypothetical protein